jgi:ABC-type enterochelin transport system permease subunit
MLTTFSVLGFDTLYILWHTQNVLKIPKLNQFYKK